MKIHVIAPPRCGATAYSKQISIDNNLEFVNEPYQFDFINNPITLEHEGITLGGGNKIIDDYVIHSIGSHYFVNSRNKKITEELILIERQDKWAQLLSYVIMMTSAPSTRKIHNLIFAEPQDITVDTKFLNYMLYEWSIFDLLKKTLSDYKHLYYEDIRYDDHIGFTKNCGYENIRITNIDIVKHYFTLYQDSN